MSKKKSSQKRDAQRKAKRDREHIELIRQRSNLPEHVKVIPFNSDQWKHLCDGPDREHWINAKGIVKGLLANGEVLTNGTFVRDGESTEESASHAKDALLQIALQDDRLADVELKYAEKFGPYKYSEYFTWASKVHSLWKKTTWNPVVAVLEESKRELLAELRHLGSIDVLDLEEAFEKSTKGRNSGFPYCTSKWDKREDCVSFYMEQAKRLLDGENVLSNYGPFHEIGLGDRFPRILFKRVQFNGDTPKIRPVEGAPKGDAIAGKAFTDPLLNKLRELPQFCGFNGGERVHNYLHGFMQREFLIESDFSSFDANCQELMTHVFWILAQLFPMKYRPYFFWLLNYMQKAAVLTPEGILYSDKINGLCSGESWTSVVGTIANALAVKYTMKRMEIPTEDYDVLSFGDDIALGVDVDEFDTLDFELYMRELGMQCNYDKQHVTRGAEARFSFLGYYHFRQDWLNDSNYEGVFPIMRIAPALFYRERFLQKEDLISKAGVTDPEVIQRIREADGHGLMLMALASKMNNCRNHKGFLDLIQLMREASPKGLRSDLMYPFEVLRVARLSGRFTRGQSLAEMPVMKFLMDLEDMESRGELDEI